MKFYGKKEKEILKLKESIDQFSPEQKLVEIIKRLNISEDTERIIVEKIYPQN